MMFYDHDDEIDDSDDIYEITAKRLTDVELAAIRRGAVPPARAMLTEAQLLSLPRISTVSAIGVGVFTSVILMTLLDAAFTYYLD